VCVCFSLSLSLCIVCVYGGGIIEESRENTSLVSQHSDVFALTFAEAGLNEDMNKLHDGQACHVEHASILRALLYITKAKHTSTHLGDGVSIYLPIDQSIDL